MLDPEIEARRAARRLAAQIAATLGETDPGPLNTIGRMVLVLGEVRCLALREQALQVFADGGLPTDDGQRQRTLGGVFFKLAKSQVTGREFFRGFGPRSANSSNPTHPARRPGPFSPLTWADTEALAKEVLALPKGEASTVEIIVIGRPERVIEKQEVVITSMKNSTPPSLPKGLPAPPADSTLYIVYMTAKQWRKVKASLDEQPDDKLIIEGYPRFDKRIGQQGAMTIYAQNVTTKLLQQAKRQVQQAGA